MAFADVTENWNTKENGYFEEKVTILKIFTNKHVS